ncbi:hypothetical protein ACLKA6_004719 [Drosophila palustris]
MHDNSKTAAPEVILARPKPNNKRKDTDILLGVYKNNKNNNSNNDNKKGQQAAIKITQFSGAIKMLAHDLQASDKSPHIGNIGGNLKTFVFDAQHNKILPEITA